MAIFLWDKSFGFHTITLYDRAGGVHDDVIVPDAGDVINIPQDMEQSPATYESEDVTWSSGTTQNYINQIWNEQGKTYSEDHWAYITVNGEKRYLVAMVPTYGLPGDYVDIYVTNEGTETVYPCIIGDSKDIWVDVGYTWSDGIVYGHDSGGRCNIIEVMSELSNASSDWSVIGGTGLLDRLKGVTKVVNGGNMVDNPEGPIGLEGASSQSVSMDSESSTFPGAIGSFFRNIWVAICSLFDNLTLWKWDATVFYTFKEEEHIIQSTDYQSGGIYVEGFVQYYQDDYANVAYGSSNIAACGCGPTCFAMIASTINQTRITPEDAVRWCGNAYYVWNLGTSWSYFEAAKNYFDLNCTIRTTDNIDSVESALRAGALVISSQTAGIFTSGGHFIVLAGINSDGGIIVKDPNKNNAVNRGYNDRTFTKDEISASALNYWIFTY